MMWDLISFFYQLKLLTIVEAFLGLTANLH